MNHAKPGADGPLIPAVARAHRLTKIQQSLDNLPSMPLVVSGLLKVLGDERSSVSDLEKYFRSDIALATKMLRLANSAFFSFPDPINSISHAAAILGYKTMRSLALSAWASDLLGQELKTYGYGGGGLWKHSLGTAFVARASGHWFKTGGEVAEELFVGGLLHDVGKLPLAQHVEETLSLVPSSSESTVEILERECEYFDTNHAVIGAEMAKRWRLSPTLAEVILHHHNPDPEVEAAKQAAAVHVADWCCNTRRVGTTEDRPAPASPSAACMEILQLTESDLASLLERSDSIIEQAKSMESQML